MKMSTRYVIGILSLLVSGATWASSVTVPNTFTANTPAKAAQVNANFAALVTAINTLESTVAAQANTISTLQSQLVSVQDSQVMALNPYLTVDTTSDARGPLVTLSGVNLQVVNGMGSTETSNGLGNIIIGYDEADTLGTYHCTIGYNSSLSTPAPVTTQSECSAAGGTWTSSGFKTGSHYLIVGSQNNYSGYGGIVSGYRNTSNYHYASVTGGFDNTASGPYSSVSGGGLNTAGGLYSSVSSGFSNTAVGRASSVSGGNGNIANGNADSISGGLGNTANNLDSSVSGGESNTADSNFSSVSGGLSNKTSAILSSVSGGESNTAGSGYSSILGGNSVTTTTVDQTSP